MFVNHGDDENSQMLAAKIAEQFGLPVDVPWSGACFDLLRGEWVRLTEPVIKEKKKLSGQEKKRRQSKNQDYRLLIDACQALLRYAENMAGCANRDIRRLTQQIKALMK